MHWREWIEANESLLAWLGGASAFCFLATLVAIPVIIIYMPKDYFIRPDKAFPRTPLRQGLHMLKNLLGYFLIFIGLLMLVLPGQGLLTMLVGLSIIDFRGKRRLQFRLIRLRGVRASVVWFRRKAHRPPLLYPTGP